MSEERQTTGNFTKENWNDFSNLQLEIIFGNEKKQSKLLTIALSRSREKKTFLSIIFFSEIFFRFSFELYFFLELNPRQIWTTRMKTLLRLQRVNQRV